MNTTIRSTITAGTAVLAVGAIVGAVWLSTSNAHAHPGDTPTDVALVTDAPTPTGTPTVTPTDLATPVPDPAPAATPSAPAPHGPSNPQPTPAQPAPAQSTPPAPPSGQTVIVPPAQNHGTGWKSGPGPVQVTQPPATGGTPPMPGPAPSPHS